jgi:PAS domain S-box-containing protein
MEIGFNVALNANAMLAYWDKDLICRFANKAYMGWLGLNPEDMIDKMHLSHVLGPLYQENLIYIHAASQGKTQVFEQLLITPLGETKKTLATYSPDCVDGAVIGFYTHIADISSVETNLFFNNHDNPDYEKHVPSFNGHLLDEVAGTLKASILSGFPGIPSLSKKHFISESKLKRDFKSKYGFTVFTFYRNLQMELAHRFLSEKRYNKNQLALMLNFSNPSNFSACYQKYLKEKSTSQSIINLPNENDERYKTFIEQAPVAIAMFDDQMLFMAVSQKWLSDYNLQRFEVIGKSIYDALPDTGKMYQQIYLQCLNGDNCICDEVPAERHDGLPGWLRWNLQPWYKKADEIGGVIIYTEDITAVKLKEEENKKIAEILNKTSEISQIGMWTKNFRTNCIEWSAATKEIFEVPESFEPTPQLITNFLKKAASRKLVEKILKKVIKKGESFDIELEIMTAKGHFKLIRTIGYPEFYNGRCEKVSGIFQDITSQHYPS